MSTVASSLSDQAFVVLDESLPTIGTALVTYYGFSEAESEAFKDTLAVWFHRVVRRGGGRTVNAEELREQLLLVACKYARAFQLAKADQPVGFEEPFATALRTPPEEVALAILNRIQPKTGRA
jgi:hypothetical protein